MEYIGEVIPNHEFIRRTKEYEAAGLEHYYFMTLKTDEVYNSLYTYIKKLLVSKNLKSPRLLMRLKKDVWLDL